MNNCLNKLEGPFKRNLLLYLFLQLAFIRVLDAVEPGPNHYAICGPFMSRLVYLYERGSLGLESDPFRTAGEGQPVVPQEHPQSSFRFESDALAVLEQPPGFREAPLQAFAATWGLTRTQAVTILDYYSSRLFYADLEATGSNRDMAYRLQALARGHWLGDVEARVQNPSQLNSSDRLALRYRYYLLAVTRRSVPEMARELRVPEHQVYQDLSELQLSIELSFREPLSHSQRRHLEEVADQRGVVPSTLTGCILEIANHLIERLGWSEEDAARALGVGPQALRFIRHASHQEPRGVNWNRELTRDGVVASEENILRQMHESGESAAAIANQLNQLSNTIDPASPLFRTEASVSAKLRSLHNSTPRTPLHQSNIQITPYGFVKLAGQLTETPVIEYLIDNYDPNSPFEINIVRLSQPLGVTTQTLERFIERHTLVLTNAPALERLREPLRARRAHTLQLAQRHSALIDSTFERFSDLEGNGGVAALRAGVLDGFGSRTRETIISLASHLSPEESHAFETLVYQLITNRTAGSTALILAVGSGNIGARRQIFNVLVDLIERHNRWVAERSSRSAYTIALSELETESGMLGVLYKLTRRAEYVHRQALERFSNLESGGILAFRGKILEGYYNRTREVFISLAAHLSLEERNAFEALIPQLITNRSAGSHALARGENNSARRQIFNALIDLIERHNWWVAENPLRSSRHIMLSELETETGMREILYKLTQRPEYSHSHIFEHFANLETGGIAMFKGGTLDGFSFRTPETIISLASHLSSEERRALEVLVLERITNKKAGAAALGAGTSSASARRQIFNALIDLIERHNRWVAENPSRNSRSIALSELQSEAGMRGVLYKLTQRAEYFYPQTLARFSNVEDGGITAFRGRALDGFSTRISETLISLASHLPPEERSAFEAIIPQFITNRQAGNTALNVTNGAADARRQIFNALVDLIDRHNRWVAENPSRQSRTIAYSDLESETGMRNALYKLTQRTEYSHPLVLERFSNLEGGGIAAFRERTLDGFSVRAPEVIISFASHLPSAERQAFEALIPQLITNRSAGNSALSATTGSAAARRQIFNALADLIERHNRWVAQDPARSSRAIVLTELETEAGMREVLRKLQGN